MKKRVLIGLVLALALCVVLAGVVWATLVSGVVSDTDTKVYYYGLDGSSYPVTQESGLPSNWNMPGFDDSGWAYALAWKHDAWLTPGTPPFGASAQWIVPGEGGAGPDYNEATGPRGVYLYRKTYTVPGVAYNITVGQAAIASDNYGWLYVDGTLILSPKDPTQNDRNFEQAVGPSTGPVPASAVVCGTHVLAAEVQNGTCSTGGYCPDAPNGPTGVVFSLALNYEVPEAVWQPPVTNADFALKDGTTLPLKFKLEMQDGTLITDMQDVYLVVHGPSPSDEVIVTWHLGDGIESLRWSGADEYYYIANFQTRNYELEGAATYTALVHDGCTGEALGSIDFVLDVKAGRGNSSGK